MICLEQNAPQQQLAYLDTVLTNGKYSYGIQYFDDMGNGSAIAYSDAVLYAGNRLSTKGPANVIVNKLNEPNAINSQLSPRFSYLINWMVMQCHLNFIKNLMPNNALITDWQIVIDISTSYIT